MHKYILAFAVLIWIAPAYGVMDPDPDMIGIYFDTSAEINCLNIPANTPFTAYLVMTNPTSAAVDAYQLGIFNDMPLEMRDRIFRLASIVANGVVTGVDSGTSSTFGGTFLVALDSPLPTANATILHAWTYMLLEDFYVEMYIGSASSVPPPPGDFPVVRDAATALMVPLGQSTGGPDVPVATVNSGCVVGDKAVSFGRLKSLYR